MQCSLPPIVKEFRMLLKVGDKVTTYTNPGKQPRSSGTVLEIYGDVVKILVETQHSGHYPPVGLTYLHFPYDVIELQESYGRD